MTSFNFNVVVFISLMVAAMAFYVSPQPTIYVVGDDDGWNIPGYPTFYDKWASIHDLYVGDSLQFNFKDDEHDVAETDEQTYDECNTDEADPDITKGGGIINLTTEGVHHFISTIKDDCQSHLKLAVYVNPSSSA
ncbi:mavicyanin-like [Rutidosis leptorrhynchoides]|uniref:mavicyanin-like n=1 Tax=Rutidosis leptorrhynchoides TaxID=125765 RepID=UPI003A9A2FE8